MPNPLVMPCPKALDCFPCFVLPTTNTSAEAPDVIQEFSIAWGNPQNNTPPLGSLFIANGCQQVCFSSLSQTDADLCAARQQANCVITVKWGPPPVVPPPQCITPPCDPQPPPPVLPPPFPVFSNNPASCIAHCPDGTPFTFTVAAGQFVAQSQILADREAASFACREATLQKICITVDTTETCLNQQHTINFTATGEFLDPAANLWQLTSGALPPGFNFSLTLSGPTLPITGTPTTAGSYTFNMRCIAPNGSFMDKQFSICVIDVIPATLPSGNLGVPYSQQMGSTSCAQLFSWAVTAGTLPPGLSLDPGSGILSGTPTVPGTFNFTIGGTTALP